MLILAVAIAILGIINTLLLSVFERTREIGLLRAIGMGRRQVRSVVRWESVIFSLQGTIIGTAIGFLFAWALVRALKEQANFISLAIPWPLLIVMVIAASIAGVIAAVIPAFSASRLKVLDAIATE
jgi:putative ABC transport system permease protein